MKILSLLLTFTLPILAAFPDGQWNGKPWEKEKLLAGVRDANPDALAEWAYASYYAYGIPFDSHRALERARIAGKNGSPFGQALAAAIILDGLADKTEKQIELIPLRQAAQTGHPWARYLLAKTELEGFHLPQRTEGKLELLQTCLKNGVLDTCQTLGEGYRQGWFGVVDVEKAAGFWDQAVTEHRDCEASYDVFSMAFLKGKRSGVEFHQNADVINLAQDRVSDMAALEKSHGLFAQGLRVLSYGGDSHSSHKALSMVLAAANQGHYRSYAHCVGLMKWSRTIRKTDEVVVTGYSPNWEQALWNLAQVADVNTHTKSWGAMYAFRKTKGEPTSKLDREGLAMLHDAIRQEPFNPFNLDRLGSCYFFRYKNNNNDQRWVPALLAVHTYNSDLSFFARSELARFYSDQNLKTFDPAKGIILSEMVHKQTGGSYLKKLEQWIAQNEKALTPEDRERMDQLLADGFPGSEKFRREAFDWLMEEKILPEGIPYRRPKNEEGPAQNDPDLEDVRLTPSLLPGLLALKLSANGHSSILIAENPPAWLPPTDQTLVKALLSGQPVPPQFRKPLAELILRRAEDLTEALRSMTSPQLQASAAMILKQLEQDAEPGVIPSLGSTLGTFLIPRTTLPGMFAIPMITSVEHGSPAARAGFLPGDLLFEIEVVKIGTPYAARNNTARLFRIWPPGTTLDIKFTRPPEPRRENYQGGNPHPNATLTLRKTPE